jgi:hypothetical protein
MPRPCVFSRELFAGFFGLKRLHEAIQTLCSLASSWFNRIVDALARLLLPAPQWNEWESTRHPLFVHMQQNGQTVSFPIIRMFVMSNERRRRHNRSTSQMCFSPHRQGSFPPHLRV